jgi:hypothetical protein
MSKRNGNIGRGFDPAVKEEAVLSCLDKGTHTAADNWGYWR